MSTAFMTQSIAVASPRSGFRTAGFLWWLAMLTGTYSMLASDKLVVAGDAATTAIRISTHSALFRSGIAAGVMAIACYVAATLLLYAILKPVNSDLSLFAALFSLAGCATAAFSFVCRLAPFAVHTALPFLIVFTAEQRRALSDMFLTLQKQTSNISFTLFGLHCLIAGYLILRAGQSHTRRAA
jgi:Domain of unknown function (DUF4386)